jgi:hypothetical protein
VFSCAGGLNISAAFILVEPNETDLSEGVFLRRVAKMVSTFRYSFVIAPLQPNTVGIDHFHTNINARHFPTRYMD